MKRRHLLLFLSFAFFTLAHAAFHFEDTKKYRITCGLKNYEGGVTIGPEHSSVINFLYEDDITDYEDAWWYINKDEKNHYTFHNAKTGQYIKFTDLRIVTKIKGLMLADDLCGDSTSWTIDTSGEGLIITSVVDTEKCFHLRSDGTNLLGVYYTSSASSPKSIFKIYDEVGNEIDESWIEPIDSTDYGTNELGECWEKSGLEEPIVETEDKEEPILYRIQNQRTGKFVSMDDNGYLTLTEDEGTSFYFIEGYNGYNIFSENEKYVAGDTRFADNNYIKTTEGTTINYYNTWGFNYSGEGDKGYGIYLAKGNGMASIPDDNYWQDNKQGEVAFGPFDESSTFIFYSKNKYHKRHLEQSGMTFSTPAVNTMDKYISSLSFDYKEAVYDELNNIYMVSIPEEYRGEKDFSSVIRFTAQEGVNLENATIVIKGDTSANRQSLTIDNIDCHKKYNIELLNSKKQIIAEDYFTFDFLPIVEISLESCNGNSYTPGSIKVHDGNSKAVASTFNAKYKYRGATAQSLNKKSFNVKTTDDIGEKMDVRFFGLRSDNSWVLDAMGVDYSRMRNRVGTDLWNDFSHPLYYKDEEPKALNGTRGQFVEVIYNGAYHGIYCMTEKIDRKQLNLQKYVPAEDGKPSEIHGLLYKSKQWSYTVLMGHDPGSDYYPGTLPSGYNNDNSWWNSFEAKYPDIEDGEEIDWEPLYDAICLVAANDENQFIDKVYDKFDVGVFLDYSLFIELLMSTDNHGKNMYYSVYDQDKSKKLNISPWDLDGTFGRDWYGRTSRTKDASQDYDIFMDEQLNGGMGIYHRFKTIEYFSWSEDVAARYREIRTNYFNPDSLCKRFEDYAALFAESGADDREKERWSGSNGFSLDIPEEIPYITNWLRERIKAMDKKYEYNEIVSDIDRFVENNRYAVSGRKGYLLIRSDQIKTFKLFNISGQLVRTIKTEVGLTKVDNLTAGIYIIAGKKVIVE